MLTGNYNYQDAYLPLFVKNYARYQSLQERLDKRMARILSNPYHNTELLRDQIGALNLKGCRSAQVGRNFRIIFVVCEECRKIKDCEYCFCEGLDDKAVVFLTVGPHKKAYDLK